MKILLWLLGRVNWITQLRRHHAVIQFGSRRRFGLTPNSQTLTLSWSFWVGWIQSCMISKS